MQGQRIESRQVVGCTWWKILFRLWRVPGGWMFTRLNVMISGFLPSLGKCLVNDICLACQITRQILGFYHLLPEVFTTKKSIITGILPVITRTVYQKEKSRYHLLPPFTTLVSRFLVNGHFYNKIKNLCVTRGGW